MNSEGKVGDVGWVVRGRNEMGEFCIRQGGGRRGEGRESRKQEKEDNHSGINWSGPISSTFKSYSNLNLRP